MFKSARLNRIFAIASFFAITGICAISDYQPLSNLVVNEAVAQSKDNIVLYPDDNLPIKGDPNAIVTIIEFSDYQCPFCSRAEPTLDQLLQDYPTEVRVAFAQNPLAFHQNAKPAAKASYAAWKQGKFWEMHELLFANQKELSREFYIEKAEELGLNSEKFIRDMDSDAAESYIQKCMDEGQPYGVSGTPSFVINGVLFVGAQPIDKFKEVIDKEIARANEVAKSKKLKGDKLYRELVQSAPKNADKDDADNDTDKNDKRHYIADGKSPILGDKNAPITIVEFTDFQCPFCKRANDTIHTLMVNNPGKIRILFKHYPLPFHDKAKLAHQAAEAAKNQKKFWEYHDLLFANSNALTREDLIDYAERLNLNMKKFIADMDDQKTIDIVEADIKEGSDAGVRGTPHFLLNGSVLSGAQPLEAFQRKLDSELEVAKKYKKLKGAKLYEKIVNDAPEPEKIKIDIAGSPTLGKAKAPVQIFLFTDFQCPFCNRLRTTLDTIMADPDYKDKVMIVYKNMPLPFHSNAQKAAEAGMYAHRYGKFVEMHNAMFEDQDNLTIDDLKAKAKSVGLDPDKLEKALDDETYKDTVQKDIDIAKALGISGTPTMVINGEMIVGALPLDTIKSKIDKALADSKKDSGKKKGDKKK